MNLESSDGNTLLFTLEDSQYVVLNLIPTHSSENMTASIEYRLVNKLQEQFVYETLIIMAVGVLLIVLFGLFLYKALSSSINLEI